MRTPLTGAGIADLRSDGIVAVLRGGDADASVAVGEVLLAHGVRWLEVTTNSPGWSTAVRELARRGAMVGTGTVLTTHHVEEASDAGARFVVAPDTSVRVGEAALERGLSWFPGAFTPSEIVAAHRLGATVVKVFPAAEAGGPAYLRAVRAPLGDIPLMPTGGVRIQDIAEYRAAGAVAVGLGTPLVGDALGGGSLEALAARARAAVSEARAKGGRTHG